MKDDEMIKLVKRIGSDVALLQSFLSKLSAYIHLTNTTKVVSFDFDFVYPTGNEIHVEYKITEVPTGESELGGQDENT